MSDDAIARQVTDSESHNTLASRTVEITFQRSPGNPEEDTRGIAGIQWRVMSDGVEVQSGTTEEDGIVHVEIRGSAATVLELIHEGIAVSQYQITIREGGYEPDAQLIGVQRRLRQLGYQLGHHGESADGIDGEMGRKTDAAIQDFQIDQHMEFDSVIGDRTKSALNDEVGGSAEMT